MADADPTKSESIYKAVKRLIENNGITRGHIEAVVVKVATDQIRATLSAWWTENKLREEFSRSIRDLVQKHVQDEVKRMIARGTITLTIEAKP